MTAKGVKRAVLNTSSRPNSEADIGQNRIVRLTAQNASRAMMNHRQLPIAKATLPEET